MSPGRGSKLVGSARRNGAASGAAGATDLSGAWGKRGGSSSSSVMETPGWGEASPAQEVEHVVQSTLLGRAVVQGRHTRIDVRKDVVARSPARLRPSVGHGRHLELPLRARLQRVAGGVIKRTAEHLPGPALDFAGPDHGGDREV